ncbi:MAG: hypothetical protein U5P41_03655 [Gammaproteobacteria bacterium]|nr:hypothetical protein [Gammaproteobacteria bacterium]
MSGASATVSFQQFRAQDQYQQRGHQADQCRLNNKAKEFFYTQFIRHVFVDSGLVPVGSG